MIFQGRWWFESEDNLVTLQLAHIFTVPIKINSLEAEIRNSLLAITDVLYCQKMYSKQAANLALLLKFSGLQKSSKQAETKDVLNCSESWTS